MNIRHLAGSIESHIVEYSDAFTPQELLELESELRDRLGPWAANHRERYDHMGTLPHSPVFFPDQRIVQTGRRALWDRQTGSNKYLGFHKAMYAKAVGNAALARQIIDTFQTTPAFSDDESISLVDYTAKALEDGQSIAVVSGHLDRLADIADFTDGLNLALIEKFGPVYADRFKVVVNKLMTRETMFKIPMAWLISVGLAPRWGLPGVGANKWGISKEAQDAVNGLLAKTLVKEMRSEGQVVGIVPAGSAPEKQLHEDESLAGLVMPHSADTTALFPRFSAVIPANRWGKQIKIGQVIPIEQPKEANAKRQYSHELIDHINQTLAEQASELAGYVPVQYEKAVAGAGIVSVKAVQPKEL